MSETLYWLWRKLHIRWPAKVRQCDQEGDVYADICTDKEFQ